MAFDAYPDWPKDGVTFYDVHGLLRDAHKWAEAIHFLADEVVNQDVDLFLGIDSRGFLLASPLSVLLCQPMALARKPGKLPGSVIQEEFCLEYGTDVIEVQKSAIWPGCRVAIVDDVVATGGTAIAAKMLIEKLNAVPVCVLTLLEIPQLGAEQRLNLPIVAWAGT